LAWAIVVIGAAVAVVELEWLAVVWTCQFWTPIARAVAVGLIFGLVITAVRRGR
jgi:hypothetical protein